MRARLFPSSAPACLKVAAASLVVAVALTYPPVPVGPASLHAQSSSPGLIQAANLSYEGAFRLPHVSGDDSQTFRYGADVIAFDPYRNSIWGVGHDHYQRIAEITVPTPVNGALGSLPTATIKTPWFDTGWRSQVMGGTVKIGGILPQADGSLVISAYAYYDTGGQVRSHFKRAPDGSVSGPFTFNTAANAVAPGQAGAVSGYMGDIPVEWRALFGGPSFAGNCCLSIISRTSLGPAFSVFDPAHVGGQNPVPSKELLGYPITQPTLGSTDGSVAAGNLFNGSTSNNFLGGFFVPGTRSVLFVQKIGTGIVNYAHGYNAPPYVLMVLAYDANDLLAVKNGSKRPWEIVPYANWNLTPPLGDLEVGVSNESVAYDPSTGRVFTTIHTGAGGGEHIVLVWRVNGASTTPLPPPPPPPPGDTTAPAVGVATPTSGATVSGSVTVTASATDNVGVAGVQFTVDGANLGAEDTVAPYQAMWASTGASNGSHTLRAIARDAAGNSAASGPVSVTVNNSSSDTIAPTVSVTSPSSGTTVGGTITVAATAADNVSVVGVRFTVDGLPIGVEDTTAPYSTSWSTSAVAGGSHTLRAIARDAAANSTTSAAVTVTVDNGSQAPPPPSSGTVVPVAPPLPAPSGTVVNVSTVSALQAAVASLTSNTTIVIAPGTYALTNTLFINATLSNVTIRGASNNRDDVVLVGRGMGVATSSVPHGIWAGGNVTGLTIANLTVRDVYQHAIMFNAGTESPRVYNVRLADAGQQLLKSSPDGAGGGVDNGVVEYSIFEYTNTAVDGYTNGVDVHTGRNWIIRHNLFRRIRAPQGMLAGPAVLFWNGSTGTVVDGNAFVDCQREVSLGLMDRTPSDHSGGMIRNNFIVRNAGMGGDVAIAVFDSPNTAVFHNTALLGGQYPNAIEYRFAGSSNVNIVNNLSDATAQARDGATATLRGNVWTAAVGWFVDPTHGDLHLTSAATSAIDRGSPTDQAGNDWDNEQRPNGMAPDVGADEFGGSGGPGPSPDTTGPAVQINAPTGGATVNGTVLVAAGASDNVGVVGVRFLLDGASLGTEDLSAPYEVSWTTTGTSNGSHTLRAVARDAAGNTTTSSAVTVTVNNGVADTVAPLVGVTSPAAGASVSGTVAVTANASDNIGVAGVRFTVDGNPVGAEDLSAPYQVSWTTTGVANGTHALRAIARDAAGNTATSAAVTVTVNNATSEPPASDTTAPTVGITSPSSGSTVGGSTSITAAAGDNVGVVGVRFTIDGITYGTEDTTAPYGVAWSTAGVSNGSHTLRAIARDAAGNTSTSQPVTVTVDNNSPAPTPVPGTIVPVAPPLPAPTGQVVHVSTVAGLHAAIAGLTSNVTIMIAPGTYPLASTLWINGAFSNVTIRGASNNRDDVVLVGGGMGVANGNVPHGIWVGNHASGVMVANLTIRDIAQHGILLNTGVQSPRIYNVRIADTGQQLLKASPNPSGGGVDNGIVEYSIFEYTNTATEAQTNGVEIHAGRNWVVRYNLFRRIRAAQKRLAGPAILAWNGASGTTVDSNVFIDCQREISFGLVDRSGNDHVGGIIRNNVIVRNTGMGGDVAIGVFDSPNTKVVHNTVLLNREYPHAIEYRFAGSTGVLIVNNLSDSRIQARNGATGTLQGNVLNASAGWFVDPARGDLHLTSLATAAIDRGATTMDAPRDWDNEPRPLGAGPDVGADEVDQ